MSREEVYFDHESHRQGCQFILLEHIKVLNWPLHWYDLLSSPSNLYWQLDLLDHVKQGMRESRTFS